jgi:hypothetical protein
MKDELAPFRSIHHPQAMREWLDDQRTAAIKTLAVDRDVVGLHQAQGKLQIIERMIGLLEKAQVK